jgi:hypothetical protein
MIYSFKSYSVCMKNTTIKEQINYFNYPLSKISLAKINF